MNHKTKVKTLFNKINKSKSFKDITTSIRPYENSFVAFIEFTYYYRNNEIKGAIQASGLNSNLQIAGYSHTIKITLPNIVININDLGATQDLNKLKKILNQHWGLY